MEQNEPGTLPQYGPEFMDVWEELRNQFKMKAAGRFPHVPSDPEMTDGTFMMALCEELGEIARAMQEKSGTVNDVHNVELYKELTQLAALCVSRMHGMNKQMESK